MKKLFTLSIIAAALLFASCTNGSQQGKGAGSYQPIETPVPARPAGQKHVLGLRAPKLDTVRVGFIGLGMRGRGAVERFTHIPGTKIVALCDLHADRVERSQEILEKAGLPRAAAYSGSEEAWKELCKREDIDLVYIATDWVHHAPMLIYAMEQGKHAASEVPAAMTLEEIWDVINTAERTQKHCMQLENCVYDFFELTTLNMAQQGVLGEILYAEGAYIHMLEDFWEEYEGDWRMEYNKKHRGDIYATHGMGPACQVLDIHRGDKMNYLVAMDSKPVSIPAYLKAKRGEEVTDFQNGQHTMTMIRTEKGKTIHIQHDVASPRPYSRMYQVQGTKGFASKYPREGYALKADAVEKDAVPNHEKITGHSYVPEEVKRGLMEKYKHPIHIEIEETAKKVGGHGGMDYVMDYRLIYCLQNGLPLDMDVYDLAEWCCLAPLTALSLENNSAPVAVPDFTRGHWNDVKGFRHAFAN
ncbi:MULTISPECIES: Gfo/Idh/MocA family protein [Petrimonas]|jgi:predicted dehydrogenase|uniref:Glycosyl hydrolase family 109 protein 1 n=1 Tax=Petrimonas mucosa TaxID=1642646 RepID=A0A1G4GBA7_9BACT|nr:MULTISPECIES: Gfo/Idh/MocA family oxidoreductase [Petrimonas]MDD3561222.1 Gfo/Idh/MocA family oxidoreductase [Petrimonas mucosa]SCM59761.1 Glycosyl hydrolase family 109 protein 1 [Petrimonas mucosa]SFU42349.1 Predicted dehydrogenase [Porphyromonadaceae bacterium KHP3R9]HHT30090.1 Gfo/Idh/MocA family oxidoreductase [Petrimonas mucosa]